MNNYLRLNMPNYVLLKKYKLNYLLTFVTSSFRFFVQLILSAKKLNISTTMVEVKRRNAIYIHTEWLQFMDVERTRYNSEIRIQGGKDICVGP